MRHIVATPPLGWNSWNKLAANVSEDLIKTVAVARASNGMEEAGYKCVVIDDCGQVNPEESVPAPARSGTVAPHSVVTVKITP